MIAEGRPKAKAFAKNVFVNQERKSERAVAGRLEAPFLTGGGLNPLQTT